MIAELVFSANLDGANASQRVIDATVMRTVENNFILILFLFYLACILFLIRRDAPITS